MNSLNDLMWKLDHTEEETWDLTQIDYKVLCQICWMGRSSLEIALYGSTVPAKQLERHAWTEIEERLHRLQWLRTGNRPE